MSEELPKEFDVIVIGTGLEESIVAANAARNGYSVLHLDFDDHYGGVWAAFTFEGIQKWIKARNEADLSDHRSEAAWRDSMSSLLEEGEKPFRLKNGGRSVSQIVQQWHVGSEEEDECAKEMGKEEDVGVDRKHAKDPEPDPAGEEIKNSSKKEEVVSNAKEREHGVVDAERGKKHQWTRKKIQENSRKFNLDLTPRLLFSRGSMVELLISSNISRYTEFKAVSRVLTLLNGSLESVPSSRADVFSTNLVSVVEKRIIMKFVTFCLNYEAHPEVYEAFEKRTFYDFLKHQKLTDNLIHFVLHSMAMVDKSTSCLEGLKATKKFLGSVGRFGSTPFLWSMYGSGELPQAFCRLCAVFGGTYYLGRPVDALIVDQDKSTVVAVICNEQRITCKHLVIAAKAFPTELKARQGCTMALRRKICLLADSMLPSNMEQLTFMSLPPENGLESTSSYTFVHEVGYGTAACPRSMYVLHVSQERQPGQGVADDENWRPLGLDHILPEPARSDKLLWTMDFEILSEKGTSSVLTNVHLCCGPVFELDYDFAIENAKRICSEMFPGEEFLPRAPDPEEIVIEEPPQETKAGDSTPVAPNGGDGGPAVASGCSGGGDDAETEP